MKLYLLIGFFIILVSRLSGQVAINTDGTVAAGSAMLDVKSTNKGVLIPRMTAVQRTGISAPATGLLVYQTDATAGIYYYTGSGWMYLGTREGGGGHVIDADGITYTTVKIGDQEWMAENLRVTHYRNGDPIDYISPSPIWSSLSTGAYCMYDNWNGNINLYGFLYNWYAVNDPRNICPTGWHEPTDAEWTNLTNYLGGAQISAGGNMKTDIQWTAPNSYATNLSGFSGLPGGYRSSDGTFYTITYRGYFWSDTESGTNAWGRYLETSSAQMIRLDYPKTVGMSVRCMKDY